MSNGGFERFLSEQGIRLERAPVGDKYVAQRIAETGARIGGEQSGHIIFPHLGPTGDGLATALELIRVLVESGKSAADWYDQFENWPQVLINLEVERKQGWEENPRIAEAIAAAEARLADHGRVNVRASGTQPILRLMVEADRESERDEVAELLQSILLAELGGGVYSRVDLTHALGD
jgi:phosphoglucosamine mutase